MDSLLSTRCNMMSTTLDDADIYVACGLDPLNNVYDIGCQIEKDIKTLISTKFSPEPIHHRYYDILIYIGLLKRQAKIKDVNGIRWSISNIYKSIPVFDKVPVSSYNLLNW